jgi:SAM-dependent methyltransferase
MSEHPFDEQYFKTGTYATVTFAKYSQYWWSNRFYAGLARRFGPPSGRVIELGCGLGHLLDRFTDRYDTFGIDINPWALEQARKNVPQAIFSEQSAEELSAFPDRHFAIVISKHNVEHLPHPERSIAEMGRLLTPGGLLVLATPNLTSLMRAVKKENWIGFRDRTHISLKPPAAWLGLVREHGMAPFKVFSDGFWDAPYLPLIPARLQKIFFGAPGGLQAILGWSIIPVRLGESVIILARKTEHP